MTRAKFIKNPNFSSLCPPNFCFVQTATTNLVVNSLSLLGSINPVLFPAESPDYVKHSAGIPILCQSCLQIFLQKPNISPKAKIFSRILTERFYKYKHSAGIPILCQSCRQIFSRILTKIFYIYNDSAGKPILCQYFCQILSKSNMCNWKLSKI